MILQAILLLLLLGAAPAATGLLINRIINEENRSLGISYIAGFLVLLAAFQIIAVPIVFLDAWGFDKIIKWFTAAVTVLSGAGIISSIHGWRRGEALWYRPKESCPVSEAVHLQQWVVVILIALQLVMAVCFASFDGDDAYYVVQSVITDETNTLYRILPYTGLSTEPDMRHSLAVFPLWIAYIARMTGTHATILCHTILPLVLIPVSYGVYYEIGKKLFADKKEKLPAYMIYICLLQIFGNVSIYSNATFLLMRTWQGKSMLANVVLPMIFMLLLWMFEGEGRKHKDRRGLWILLFLVNIVAAMMSTASVFLNVLLILVMAVILAWQEKKLSIVIKMALCCIPCAVYALLYVFL